MPNLKQAKPRLACEITTQGLIAARARSDGSAIDVHTVRRLDKDVVRPSLSAGNITNPSALGEAISGALSTVGGRKRDVVAVIPDAAARVLLLDFDTLPEKAAEAEPIIRFRLRKSIPFDADQAALSFQSYKKSNGVKVLAAVTPREVLQEYESAFQRGGYEPGYVVPSTLAALHGVDADRPTLLVKEDGSFISVAIADQNEVIFFRMLDVVAGRTGATIADEVYPSIVFFEDNYAAKIERILLCSLSSPEELSKALAEQTGIRPEMLDPGVYENGSLAGDGLPSSALAGVAGVLTHS